MLLRLVATLLVLAAVAAGEHLLPEAAYQVSDGNSLYVIAPAVALTADAALAVLSTPTLEACAAACRLDRLCTAFEHCDVQDGCVRVAPGMKYQDCRLISSNCTLRPLANVSGSWVRRTAGFPVRHQPLQLQDYTTRPAEVRRCCFGRNSSLTVSACRQQSGSWGCGPSAWNTAAAREAKHEPVCAVWKVLEGGDFVCPGSVIPDRCAFEDVRDAINICSSMAACRSVVQFHNGTDGCSSPLAVLTTSWPTGQNSYVAPTVDVLTKNSDSMVSMLLTDLEGTVLLPSEAELAAGANASDPSTAWLGCIVAEGALMDGTVVAVASNVATAEECCRACRANATCNVWNYCARAGGCSYAANAPTGSFTISLDQGELRHQNLVDPAVGWPPIVLAKGSDVPLTAGAPLAFFAPQLPGYTRLPGRLPFDYGSYDCPESEMPGIGACVLFKTPEQMAEMCNSDPECAGFMLKPLPGPPSPLRIAVPKHAVNTTLLGLSPTDVFYIQERGGSSGGLSGGAIAGIVVGSCAAAAALAGAAWLGLRHRQRLRQQQSAGAGDGDKEYAFASSSNSGNVPDGSALLSADLAGASALAGSPLPMQPCQAAAGGAAAGSGGASPRHAVADSAISPSSLPPLPPSPLMRACWNARPAPSPFAAQAATPFGSGGVTPVPLGGASGAATLGGSRSPHHGSGSRSPSVLPIPAAVAEAAAAAAAAGAATAAAAAAQSNGGLGSCSDASSEETLPELVRHVAQCDAAYSTEPGAGAAEARQHALMSVDALPPSLRASVVDVNQIRYLTWPNGRLQEIGSGASATVYRALYLNEIVAAKEIDIGRSHAMQEAFVNEALRLHQLHHPHVVALLGVTISGSTGILLMEYCAGRDLRSALGLTAAGSNERLFGWYRKGRRVILEVAKALNFLHARGVVHMDVKANNVLLTAGGTAKLADVGLSRLQTGTYLSDVPLIGTFAWIAPEVLVGSQQCSSAVDIFSLGVVMWEIITGEQPQRGSLRSPRIPEECPQEAADLMMECLSLEPSQRPTAAQVMQRLEGGHGALEATSVVVPLRSSGNHGRCSVQGSQ